MEAYKSKPKFVFYPFSIWWWQYMFAKKSYYFDASWFCVLWCRFRNHPHGPIYYSWGDEPNYHCKDCGDELN